MSQKVFVNRILNMKKIKYIGLDMDHTLIRYKTKNFETLVYQLVIARLVELKQYPKALRQFKFHFTDAIRGLVIDSKNGNILKLSRYGAIRQSYHGTRAIDYSEQNQFYRSIYVDLNDPNYLVIDTSFSIALCALYAQLVDYKDQHPNTLPNYNIMARDVLSCVDEVHGDGTLKAQIAEDLQHYVHDESRTVAGLKRYIQHGKKFFLLTNSDYHWVKIILDYAINPHLKDGENWRDLFEYVITFANKPRFFYDEDRFLSVNPDTEEMTNIQGLITPGIYQGGYAKKFTHDLGLHGDEILYIGDHIYGDILRLKKDCNWRTALVVEELGAEIVAQNKAMPIEEKIVESMQVKRNLEAEYIDLQTKSIEEQTQDFDQEIESLQEKIFKLDQKISTLIQKHRAYFNPKWDRVFRAGAEESFFAYQANRYACVYMEKLSDLLEYSPLTYFRAHRRLLAHDFPDHS